MKSALIVFSILVLTASVRAQNAYPEVFDVNRATITGLNGHEKVTFPFSTRGSRIKKYLGRPDSIRPSGYECGSTAETVYWYGGVAFDREANSVYPRELDFDNHPALKLKLGRITLSRKTTINQFRRMFPMAAKRETAEMGIWLRPFKQAYDYEKLRFSFDESGHLVAVDYWIAC